MTRPRRKPEDETPSGSTLDGPDPVGPKTIRAISDLLPDHANANRGTQRGGLMLRASIERNGAGRSVLADRNGRLIAGNKTVEAALDARLPVRVVQTDGSELVVVQRTDLDLTDPRGKARQLAFADNRVGEVNLDWSPDAIKDAFAAGAFEDLDYLFSDEELNRIVGEVIAGDILPTDGQSDPDEVPETEQPVSVLGDCWLLGRHRIVCGDSTDPLVVAAALAGAAPNIMVTDPPYGVEYDPAWRDDALGGKTKRTGKVLNDDNPSWRDVWSLFPGDVVYVWHAGLFSHVVFHDLCESGFEIRSQIIWAKPRLILSRGHYHWQHEPCWYGVRNGKTANWVGDKKQTTLWEISSAQQDTQTTHGTQKPVECMRRPIENHTKIGDPVFDPFSGSGTTIIACEMSGRTAHAIELCPEYVDVAVRRWQKFTGLVATHAESGETFEQARSRR